MSVTEHQYVIHGIKMSYDEYKTRYNIEQNYTIHDNYNGFSNNPDKDLVVVADGKFGEYTIIGVPIVKFDGSFVAMKTLSIDEFALATALLKIKLMSKFGLTEAELETSLKPALYIFTHYS